MDWFTDIPKAFLIIVLVFSAVGAMMFISSLNFGNSDKTENNLEKTTGYVVDNVVPTELNIMAWFAEKLSGHPLILLIMIIGTLWLFGYFLPK